jgi:hypothetical protein
MGGLRRRPPREGLAVVPRRRVRYRERVVEEMDTPAIVSRAPEPRVGLSYEDLRWMLDRVPAEILILRPAPEDTRTISTEAVKGHF